MYCNKYNTWGQWIVILKKKWRNVTTHFDHRRRVPEPVDILTIIKNCCRLMIGVFRVKLCYTCFYTAVCLNYNQNILSKIWEKCLKVLLAIPEEVQQQSSKHCSEPFNQNKQKIGSKARNRSNENYSDWQTILKPS